MAGVAAGLVVDTDSVLTLVRGVSGESGGKGGKGSGEGSGDGWGGGDGGGGNGGGRFSAWGFRRAERRMVAAECGQSGHTLVWDSWAVDSRL